MRFQPLKISFCFAAIIFVIFHFAENTVDPDLWGHVLFGQRMIDTGRVEKLEPFSWTAPEHSWVNHEVLAEVALGWAHQVGGGAGLLGLKLAIGLLTFWIALSMGLRRLDWPWKSVGWMVGLLATVELSFGFAARPQIFTALALAVTLWLLRKIHDGGKRWCLVLPLLSLVWINTHGGVLAGVLMMFVAAGATTVQQAYARFRNPSTASAGVSLPFWVAAVGSLAVLPVNPWGLELPRWLVGSVLWVRPEIQEWNPTPLGLDHGPFFVLLVLSLVSLITSRKPKVLWEITIVLLLGFMAFRHVRHTPLFAIAALAFMPIHITDLLERVANNARGLRDLFARASARVTLAIALALLGLAMLWATFSLHKEDAFTMEIPAGQYPVGALQFMKHADLKGNVIVYFDWGEMCIWELPTSRVSVDGRLDTSYPRSVLKANWNLYNGWLEREPAIDIGRADIAILPPWLAGSEALAGLPDWKLVYGDKVAAVFVRQAERFPLLASEELRAFQVSVAPADRVPFPDEPSALADVE